MDYREMLKKYMKHVGDREGVDFLEGTAKSEFFTDAEWLEMKKLSNEAWDEVC